MSREKVTTILEILIPLAYYHMFMNRKQTILEILNIIYEAKSMHVIVSSKYLSASEILRFPGMVLEKLVKIFVGIKVHYTVQCNI